MPRPTCLLRERNPLQRLPCRPFQASRQSELLKFGAAVGQYVTVKGNDLQIDSARAKRAGVSPLYVSTAEILINEFNRQKSALPSSFQTAVRFFDPLFSTFADPQPPEIRGVGSWKRKEDVKLYLLRNGWKMVPPFASGAYGTDFQKQVSSFGVPMSKHIFWYYRGAYRIQAVIRGSGANWWYVQQGQANLAEPNPVLTEYVWPTSTNPACSWLWPFYTAWWHLRS